MTELEFKTSFKEKILWIVLLFIFSSIKCSFAQNERQFKEFIGMDVIPSCQTYDGALLMTVQYGYGERPSYIVKQSLEGKEIWRIQLNNIGLNRNIIETTDSGFATCAAVKMYPETEITNESVDTLIKICVLKFDKCAHLQWARYVPTRNYNISWDIISGSNGDILVSTSGINGLSDISNKPITVLKFNKSGALLKYSSFEGISSYMFKSGLDNSFFLSQMLYLPLDKDTNAFYLFSGIKKIDFELNTLERVYLGYNERVYNAPGKLLVTKDRVIALTRAYYFSSKKKSSLMLSEFDKSLKGEIEPVFDEDSLYGLIPTAAISYGDSIVANASVFDDPDIDKQYSSIRLYNKDKKMLKEFKLNASWAVAPLGLLPLKNGSQFIASVVNRVNPTNDISSHYLFDRHLNSQPWPTTPPSKGYDWACNSTIPSIQVIDVEKVVTPVYVKADTSRPDWWEWVLSIKEPDPQNIARITNGWMVWPQPAVIGDALHLRLQDPRSHQAAVPMKVQFYDLQGKNVSTASAIPEGSGQWSIPSLNLPSSGLYLADLLDRQTGVSVGRIRVMVR